MADQATQTLRKAGLNVTAQRLALMRAIAAQPHSTADELIEVVRADIGTISRQAAYDSLAALSDRGLIRRIQPAQSPALYEDRVDDNHHHLLCRGCRIVIDIDCAAGEAPCLVASQTHDFVIDEAEVIYWGWCPACQ